MKQKEVKQLNRGGNHKQETDDSERKHHPIEVRAKVEKSNVIELE